MALFFIWISSLKQMLQIKYMIQHWYGYHWCIHYILLFSINQRLRSLLLLAITMLNHSLLLFRPARKIGRSKWVLPASWTAFTILTIFNLFCHPNGVLFRFFCRNFLNVFPWWYDWPFFISCKKIYTFILCQQSENSNSLEILILQLKCEGDKINK